MSAMTPNRYSAPWYADRYRWRLASREILGTAAILIVYFLLRGMRPDSVEDSVGRSLHLIRFEQRLGLFQEVTWQHAFIGHTWLIDVANLVYAWGHYPVLLAIALWLVIKDPSSSVHPERDAPVGRARHPDVLLAAGCASAVDGGPRLRLRLH
jgi:hypothetical protein